MVAEIAEAKTECSPQEMVFARLVACEGMRASRAYAIAWRRGKGGDPYATKQAAVVLDRPRVAARIAQLRAASDAASIMGMNERRRLLADTARSVRKVDHASHSERIAAIKLDAELAGEYRQEIGVGGEITVAHVLRSLGGSESTVLPAMVEAEIVPDGPLPDSEPAGELGPVLTLGPDQMAAEGPALGADAILGVVDKADCAWGDLD